MARKRKGARTSVEQFHSKGDQSKLIINSWEDVADSGDEFQMSRDKMLLEEEPARKRRRKLDEEYEELLPSDEDVLELPSDDEEEDEMDSDAQGASYEDASSTNIRQDEDEYNEGWGTSRKDYYNADAIETEADALEEEEEALRLQRKQLSGMTEADFGFDESEWLADGQDAENGDGKVEELLPQIEITDEMSSQEKTRILHSRYPEFQALSKEFVDLEPRYEELSSQARHLDTRIDVSDVDAIIPGTVLKWRALGAYLGALSMYFVIMTSGPTNADGMHTTLSPAELRQHPIMETLVRTRTQWEKAKDLDLPDPVLINGHTANEIIEVEEQSLAVDEDNLQAESKQKKPRLSKTEARAMEAKRSAKAERAARLQRTKHELAQLAATSASRPTKSSKSQDLRPVEDISDFGELPTTDVSLQDRRKKSLAFYTSQIAAKTNKRNNASKGAGGDDDIPYKERYRDRVARLNEEARNRGQGGRDELGGVSDEEDNRVAAEVRASNDNDDDEVEDYIQTIISRTRIKKEQKAARAAALKEAASRGAQVREVETVGADGKRAITYAIEKNKGLTPKRKKEVRNPRVKKRLKYEEKMKKLGSVRQLYKGGEGRGGYGGEKTGINSALVRSRKL